MRGGERCVCMSGSGRVSESAGGREDRAAVGVFGLSAVRLPTRSVVCVPPWVLRGEVPSDDLGQWLAPPGDGLVSEFGWSGAAGAVRRRAVLAPGGCCGGADPTGLSLSLRERRWG